MLKGVIDKKLLRFLIVGVCNTIVGTGLMFLLYNFFHVSYWISSASNYIVGSILSYFLNKNFTFKNKESVKSTLPRFVINIALCYLIAYGLAKPIAIRLLSGYSVSIRDNVAMLIGSGLFVVLNYFGQRFFTFKEKTQEEAD